MNEELYLTFPVVSNRLMKMIVQSGGKEIDIAVGGVEDNLLVIVERYRIQNMSRTKQRGVGEDEDEVEDGWRRR